MTILIVAGEASGDLHGSNLIKALKEVDSSLEFYGVGGERMKGLGFNALEDSRELAVVGISEVVLKLGKLFSVFNRLKKTLDQIRPDVVVLIDFPDFNLHVAKEARKRKIPVVYYIGPQVWAWRKGRVKKIARLVNKMLVVFPFEEDIYKSAGVNVEYIGHPLIGTVSCQFSKDDALSSLGMGNGPTVALLPGSRRHEVERLLPVMIKAAGLIRKEVKDVQFVLPLADTIEQALVEGMILDFKSQTPDLKSQIHVVRDRFYEVLKASDAAIVASGTATLETALMEIPMVIVYKVSLLTSIIGRMFINIDYIGLPNIVAEKEVVPELVQGNANPISIAREILRFLNDSNERNKTISDLKDVANKLRKGNASKRAAEVIYALIRSQESGACPRMHLSGVRNQKPEVRSQKSE